MWIVDDKTMDRIIGGEFKDVVVLKRTIPTSSIRRLYFKQDKYKSYAGFNKFYRQLLQSIIDKLVYINDDSIQGKLVRFFSR